MNKLFFFFCYFLLLGSLIGFGINETFFKDNCSNCKQYDGCWASVEAEDNTYDDWVCVNVENMDYQRAVEVCQHEVGHEIFAEICEKNISKCFEVVENVPK